MKDYVQVVATSCPECKSLECKKKRGFWFWFFVVITFPAGFLLLIKPTYECLKCENIFEWRHNKLKYMGIVCLWSLIFIVLPLIYESEENGLKAEKSEKSAVKSKKVALKTEGSTLEPKRSTEPERNPLDWSKGMISAHKDATEKCNELKIAWGKLEETADELGLNVKDLYDVDMGNGITVRQSKKILDLCWWKGYYIDEWRGKLTVKDLEGWYAEVEKIGP